MINKGLLIKGRNNDEPCGLQYDYDLLESGEYVSKESITEVITYRGRTDNVSKMLNNNMSTLRRTSPSGVSKSFPVPYVCEIETIDMMKKESLDIVVLLMHDRWWSSIRNTEWQL